MVLTKRDLARSWWGGGPGPKSKIIEIRTEISRFGRGQPRSAEVGRDRPRLIEVPVEVDLSRQPVGYVYCSRETTLDTGVIIQFHLLCHSILT